jgi:hypothetical protein
MTRTLAIGSVLVAMSVCLGVPTGLAGERPVYDPFMIPEEKLRAEIETVVLRSIQLPDDVEDARWDEKLTSHYVANRLEDFGFEVVAAREFQDRWLKYSQKLGGVFDPWTGAADRGKFRLVQDYVMRELAESHSVDAVAFLSVFSRATEVTWNTQVLRSGGSSLVWGGEWIPFRKRLRIWPQRVESILLGIDIYNVAGTTVYSVACPIAWAKIYMDRGFEERPIKEVYSKDHIENAVDGCLRSLRNPDPTPGRQSGG